MPNNKRPNHTLLWHFLTAAGFLLAAIVRTVNLTRSSIWHDEGFSIMLAKLNSVQIWQGSARDVHPPLYYELLHFWIKLFGSSAAAVRLMSVVASLLAIGLVFVITKKIAGFRAGLLALYFVALAPILIRYSQEARMYGILSLFMLLALFCVINIVQRPKQLWPYLVYVIAITLGLYTHYFAILAVMAFWLYLLLLAITQHNKTEPVILRSKWWLANTVAAVLYLPWFTNMLAQFSRGQGLGWLAKTDIYSLSGALWQFFTFTDGKHLPFVLYWLLLLIVASASIYVIYRDKSSQKYNTIVVLYSFLPIVVALLISLVKPVFHERYFVFVVPAIFMILAIAIDTISQKKYWLLLILSLPIMAVEIVGVRNVYAQSNHQISATINILNQQFLPNDQIVAGELYVFFDASYYNQTNAKLLLYTGNTTPNGYGESALIYNKNLYLSSYSYIPTGSRVWLIGKTGSQAYYNQIPQSWRLLQQRQAGYSELRLYRVE